MHSKRNACCSLVDIPSSWLDDTGVADMCMPKLWLPRQVSIDCCLINRQNTKHGFYSHFLFQLFSSRIFDIPSPFAGILKCEYPAELVCFCEQAQMHLTPRRDYCRCSDINTSIYQRRAFCPVCGKKKTFHKMQKCRGWSNVVMLTQQCPLRT